MRTKKPLIVLSYLTGILALVQSGIGLFSQGGGGPYPFTTLHGETVQMYGQGIYYYDIFFKAPIFRGTDAVILFLGIPLLAIATWFYARGSLRGKLFLAGVLSLFAYNSTSVVLGTAYNYLFLEYIAYFSSSLFVFCLSIASINIQELASRMSPNLPRRGIAIVLFIAGAAVLFAWLADLITWLQPGVIPGITSYTTEITYAIDLAIIAPLCFLTGILILRRSPVSYLTGTILLFLLTIIGIVVSVQTAFQLSAGIELTPGMIVGKVGSFAILSPFALWYLVRLLGSTSYNPFSSENLSPPLGELGISRLPLGIEDK